jgi:hypothetical protein
LLERGGGRVPHPADPDMNWYLLNIPLVVAIATAVVAPILVVTAREPLGAEGTGPALHELAADLRTNAPSPARSGRSHLVEATV